MQENKIPVLSYDGCRCYAYFLVISGRLSSLIDREKWETVKEMDHTAGGMCKVAKIFIPTAAVAVYELRKDDRFHLASIGEIDDPHELPASFCRHECPAPRRQNVR